MWLFALIGWLFGICAHWEWRLHGFRALGLWAAGITVLLGVELVQLTIRSRNLDVNEILSNAGGFILGSMAFWIWKAMPHPQIGQQTTIDRAIHSLFLPYLILLVLFELSPFDFSFGAIGSLARWKAVEFLPFSAYYSNTSVWSLQDLLETILLGVPTGLWVAGYFRGQPARKPVAAALIAGLAVGVFLEAGQLFTQSRFPGITDVMSFGVGSMGGSSFILAWRGAVSRLSLTAGSEHGESQARRSERPHAAERARS